MIKTHTPLGLLLAVALSFLAILAVALSLKPARSLPAASPASAGDHHFITLKASALPSGQLAYEMVSHKIKSPDRPERDITGLYAKGPTIPGPTLVMKEGDTAEVTLEHGIADSSQPISIHVHGVHYKIDSDAS